ncbi:sphingomyelin synthase [Mortierella sp. AD031]|nr:sphingomyelin synthase [Mortierella sp. AD031]
MEPHHIHIEHLHDDPPSPSHSPCNSYSSSETLDDELEQDRLNRLSSTSTLVGANSNNNNNNNVNSRSSSPFDQEVKVNPANRSSSQQRGLWYRFKNSEAGRLFSAFCYFTFVCISMAFCNQLSDHRWVETGYTQVLLRDRGFDVIAPQADIGPANFFVMTSVVLTVVGIGFICPNWTMRAVVLRRTLWVIGSLSVFRALTISVTTLPSPKEECRPSLKYGFWDMLVIAIQMIPGTVEACTDDIFSGHTVFMVSCAIQWRLYCKNKWLTYLSYLYISIGLYFVVATRLHYTVDVVLAVVLTHGFWSIYISMIDVIMEREYFGVEAQNEKYSAFDSTSTEYEFSSTYDDDIISTRHQSDFQIRRRRLEHQMNRIRGPGIGYGRGEYDRVAFVPMQLNTCLISIIRWCDGLDLRMRQDVPAASKDSSRWENLVVRYRAGRSIPSTSTTPCSSAHCIRRKPEGAYDGQNENGSEMVQLYHPNDVSAPLNSGLDDVCHCDESDYNQQENFGRWRSLPLRTASPHQRPSNQKEDKSGTKERDRKLHILKIGLIVFVNTILLVKIVEAYQGRSSAPPSHAEISINSSNNNSIQPEPTAAPYHPPQTQDQDQDIGEHSAAAIASMYDAIANDEVDHVATFGQGFKHRSDDDIYAEDNNRHFSPQTLRRRHSRPTEEPEGAI